MGPLLLLICLVALLASYSVMHRARHKYEKLKPAMKVYHGWKLSEDYIRWLKAQR